MAAKIGKILLLNLFFAVAAIAVAATSVAAIAAAATSVQVQVSASIEGHTDVEVGVGDTFTYTIEVATQSPVGLREPSPPNFGTLALVNRFVTPKTRSFYKDNKFQTEQSRNFNFALEATDPGDVTIPPAEVEVDGVVLRTNSVHVKILGGQGRQSQRRQQPGQQQQQDMFDQMEEAEAQMLKLLQQRLMPNFQGQQQPGQPQRQGRQGLPQIQPTQPINPNEAFFIQVETDKKKVYVGEQITVSFYIYTRGQITDIDTLTYPSLKGFWKEDLEMATRLNFEGVEVNGMPYQRAMLVSYALFPIRPGKSTIDQYKAKCTVLMQSNMGFGRPYSFTKASRPVEIEVLDVPKEGRSSDYSGAVGTFRVSAQFDPSTVPINQPATLHVRFEGRGNAKLIELPNLNLPPSMELYDQKSEAKFFKDGTSYKTFDVLLIPREPGMVELPPVKTSVFDPDTRKYDVIQSQPMRLSVLGAGSALPTQEPTAQNPSVKKDEDPLPGLSTDFTSATWWRQHRTKFWIILYVGIFSFLGYQVWRKFGGKPKRETLLAILKRRLRAVELQINAGDVRRVGVELTNAIYFILGQISEQGGASEEVSRLLEKVPPSVRKELGQPISALLERSEALSFAPEAIIAEFSNKHKLNEIKKEFERIMTRAIEMIDFQDPA